jgi:hypothetical protein
LIFCVEITAAFSTAQRRNNVLTILQNYVTQFAADEFHTPLVAPFDAIYKGWTNAIAAQMQLRTAANRDQVWADIQGAVTGPGAPVSGVARRYDAPLDEADPNGPLENDTTQHWP